MITNVILKSLEFVELLICEKIVGVFLLEVRSIAQCKCHHPKYAFNLLRYQLVTWAFTEIFPGGWVTSKFAYPYQVSDDAIKWTFTKRFTLSTPLVCAG